MTNGVFDNLRNRMKNDPNAVKSPFYDGTKWTDPQGNWYAWESCGYIEYVFYAGTTWKRRTDYKGDATIKEV